MLNIHIFVTIKVLAKFVKLQKFYLWLIFKKCWKYIKRYRIQGNIIFSIVVSELMRKLMLNI